MTSIEQLKALRDLRAAAYQGEHHACTANRETDGVCPCMNVVRKDFSGGLTAYATPDQEKTVSWKEMTIEQRRQAAADMDFVEACFNADFDAILAGLEVKK